MSKEDLSEPEMVKIIKEAAKLSKTTTLGKWKTIVSEKKLTVPEKLPEKLADPYIYQQFYDHKPVTRKSKNVPVGLPESIVVEDGVDECVDVPDSSEDIELVRRSMVIERIAERMDITLVATDLEDPGSNSIELVKCSGEPLGCYAYDCNSHAYYVSCKAYAELGSIGVAYRIRSQGSNDKNNVIALPDEMVEKYLSPIQKKQLKMFRDKYKAPKFSVTFMQSINC